MYEDIKKQAFDDEMSEMNENFHDIGINTVEMEKFLAVLQGKSEAIRLSINILKHDLIALYVNEKRYDKLRLR